MSVRASTRSRVHAAALALVGEVGVDGLTMEGLAARAGAGKQTLYRSWTSPVHVLLDAMLAESQGADGEVAVPDTGDLRADLATLVRGTVAEMTDVAASATMRGVIARAVSDEDLAAAVRDRLLGPQVAAIVARLARAGVTDPDGAAELVLGPIFHRWFLGTGPLDAAWADRHLALVTRALDA